MTKASNKLYDDDDGGSAWHNERITNCNMKSKLIHM